MRWSDEDIQFLRGNRFLTHKEISECIDHPPESVRKKRYQFNLNQKVKCDICSKEEVISKGRQHYCKSCIESLSSNQRRRYSIDYKLYEYKHGAISRGYEFLLTKEQFAEFWKKPCNYCGSEIDTIGLDRIDNKRGYTMDNIKSCCSTCNRMKLDLEEEFFLTHIKKIINFNNIEVA